MIAAWRRGDVKYVGALFRDDGLGLRDLYCISGPELETMCDIARTVDGVYGERMLGGGDKGAAGAIVASGTPPRRSRPPSRAPTRGRTRSTSAPCTRSASRRAWRRSRGRRAGGDNGFKNRRLARQRIGCACASGSRHSYVPRAVPWGIGPTGHDKDDGARGRRPRKTARLGD